jgi:hypothetical protein
MSWGQARAYLKSYETAPACTVSGVVVTDVATGRQVEGVDVARQWFKPIPEEVSKPTWHHAGGAPRLLTMAVGVAAGGDGPAGQRRRLSLLWWLPD